MDESGRKRKKKKMGWEEKGGGELKTHSSLVRTKLTPSFPVGGHCTTLCQGATESKAEMRTARRDEALAQPVGCFLWQQEVKTSLHSGAQAKS